MEKTRITTGAEGSLAPETPNPQVVTNTAKEVKRTVEETTKLSPEHERLLLDLELQYLHWEGWLQRVGFSSARSS